MVLTEPLKRVFKTAPPQISVRNGCGLWQTQGRSAAVAPAPKQEHP